MTIRYADYEFGLVWDYEQDSFDVSLRYTGPDNVDQPLHPRDPVHIDPVALGRLADDEAAYGAALTEAVFAVPEVRDHVVRTMAVAASNPVHFRLHVDGPVRFHAIRWELLRDPVTGDPYATSRNVLFSRYLSGGDWRPVPYRDSGDLRALVVVANPTDLAEYEPDGRHLAPIRLDEELERIGPALEPFRPVVLGGTRRATLAALSARLEEGFAILYVVAHGVQTPDVPLLFLEKEDGTADPVDARRLAERVRSLSRRPSVVLLSSCQSAGTGDQRRSDDGGALAALGPRLAEAGVPAVIAMQGNVTMRTASDFAPAFFAAFDREPVVDHAMAIARDAVRDRPDWWVPVLFSRLRSGRVQYEPQFTERVAATWDILRTMMEIGSFTPVLGPGMADGLLGSRQHIAERWARRWQMPLASHARGNLAQVAQYLKVSHNPAMVPGELRRYLRTEMHERKTSARDSDPFADLSDDFIDRALPEDVIVDVGRRVRAADAGDPFRVVADMPVDLYITTGWTDLLQDALADTVTSRGTAKKPQTVCFPWTKVPGLWNRWVDPADADPPTVERPWVYHLFGRLEEPRSLVLTEDDYFDWLSMWSASKDVKEIVPPIVKRALAGSSKLFLGYQLDDWDFRVIFQAIREFGMRDRYNSHVGVQLRPGTPLIEREAAQRYLEVYFGDDNVNIFWSDTRTFLDQLREKTGLRP